jgi:hypothetical protein
VLAAVEDGDGDGLAHFEEAGADAAADSLGEGIFDGERTRAGHPLLHRDSEKQVPAAAAGQIVRMSTEFGLSLRNYLRAAVAQLDRAVASEATGRQFEPGQPHHSSPLL